MEFVIVVAVLVVLGLGAALVVIARRGPESGQRGHHESLIGGAGRNVAQDLRAGRDESLGGT